MKRSARYQILETIGCRKGTWTKSEPEQRNGNVRAN